MTYILVVEPDSNRRAALSNALTAAGFEVSAVADVEADFNADGRPSAVVCSATLPSGSGLRLVPFVDGAPVILTAAHGSVAAAVSALKAGAANYLVHPIDAAQLVSIVQAEIDWRRVALPRPATIPRPTVEAQLVGHCGAMLELRARLGTIAEQDAPVLVVGEVGTGKESVARAIHEASRRRRAPWVSLNTARVPQSLLAVELFGIESSAAGGSRHAREGLVESADRGTLFIEDVTDLPPDLQARLLRVIDDGTTTRQGASEARRVDVRIIAASRHDLRANGAAGHVAADLLHRFAPAVLELPPLRARGDDRIELVEALLERTCARMKRPEPSLSADALQAIRDYAWPGNVRELENAIERAVILNDGRPITAADLGIEIARAQASAPHTQEDATTLEDYFVRFVTEHEDTLTETELAQKLGISRKSLWERRQRLNIPRRRTHKRGPRRDA
jgi:DNA-binding NtrC family response regulator